MDKTITISIEEYRDYRKLVTYINGTTGNEFRNNLPKTISGNEIRNILKKRAKRSNGL